MLYKITRPLAALSLKTFFRKIYISNRQIIPENKPVIFAGNHPSAFIEPCMLACFQPRPLYFITRGDLFRNPVYGMLMRALHMIPIFRFVDGYKNLKSNYDTFKFCHKALKDKKAILILAEGRTLQEKRLRPIQRGAARMAFGTIEKYGETDIYIIPVGVNYTRADKFRSIAMFEFGQPIRVLDYIHAYEKDSVNTIKVVTAELEKRMRTHIVHIEKPEDEQLCEQLFLLAHNERGELLFPIVSTSNQRLFEEINIANQVNGMKDKGKKELEKKIRDYFREIETLGINDFSLAQKSYFTFFNTLVLILGFFPFLFGRLFNYLPVWLGARIARKKVKQLEFKASVGIVTSMGFFLVYYFFLVGLICWSGHCAWAWTVLILPLAGYFSLFYQELLEKWNWSRHLTRVPKEKITEVLAQRKELAAIVHDYSSSVSKNS